MDNIIEMWNKDTLWALYEARKSKNPQAAYKILIRIGKIMGLTEKEITNVFGRNNS